MEDAIVVKDLWHNYNGTDVLKGVSFTVHRGEVFGLLGPNGAGKSTLSSILTSQLQPSRGHVSVLGRDPGHEPSRLRRKIGLVGHDLGVSPYSTAVETLRFHGHLYEVDPNVLDNRIGELLSLVGLEDKKDALVNTYSSGMKTRLNIALSLLHDPEIIFLDEPTVGLDPHGRRQVWTIIQKLRAQGKTVLLTTHYMDEAESLCDRIAMVSGGKIAALGTPAELKTHIAPGKIVDIGMKFSSQMANNVSAMVPEGRVYADRGLIATSEPERVLQHLLSQLASDPAYRGARLVVRDPSLEDVFLELTGGFLGEDLSSEFGDGNGHLGPNGKTFFSWQPSWVISRLGDAGESGKRLIAEFRARLGQA